VKIFQWSGLKRSSHVTDDGPDISRRQFKGWHGSMAVLNGTSNLGVAHILPETAGIEIRWRGAKEFGSRDVGTAVNPMTRCAPVIKNSLSLVSTVALANAPKTRHQESSGQNDDNPYSHGRTSPCARYWFSLFPAFWDVEKIHGKSLSKI
jgi:hypothetical protein